jgi:secondary thiamine-phosphate synthase enzyme
MNNEFHQVLEQLRIIRDHYISGLTTCKNKIYLTYCFILIFSHFLGVQYISASLTINENADPTVRQDLESHFNKLAPEKAPYYRHDYEGDDDMPAHIKNCLLGCSVGIPVTNGALNLGIWQGIYLCEHRNQGGRRSIVATIQGQSRISANE